jgi:16S rRNA (guanine527-N7)-methyltransferase
MSLSPDPALSLDAAFEKWSGSLTDLGPAARPRMRAFLQRLESANEQVNLVSYESSEELVLSHVVDSLAVLDAVPQTFHRMARCVDVGTGAGFPGIPLSLARPGWSVCLVESIQKKAAFVQSAVEALALANCTVKSDRAEDLAREPDHRETYDLAFCRAVGRFATGLELVLPLLRVGGCWLAHRGEDGLTEAEAAEPVAKRLGGTVTGHHAYQLPHRDKTRYIVRVEKREPAPAQYPRRPGIPAKRPLT